MTELEYEVATPHGRTARGSGFGRQHEFLIERDDRCWLFVLPGDECNEDALVAIGVSRQPLGSLVVPATDCHSPPTSIQCHSDVPGERTVRCASVRKDTSTG